MSRFFPVATYVLTGEQIRILGSNADGYLIETIDGRRWWTDARNVHLDTERRSDPAGSLSMLLPLSEKTRALVEQMADVAPAPPLVQVVVNGRVQRLTSGGIE